MWCRLSHLNHAIAQRTSFENAAFYQKDKMRRAPWGVLRRVWSFPFYRSWARRRVSHWSQCDARPTVTFPAAGYYRLSTTTKLCCLVTEAHMCVCVNNFPKAATWKRKARSRTRNRWVASLAFVLTITPADHTFHQWFFYLQLIGISCAMCESCWGLYHRGIITSLMSFFYNAGANGKNQKSTSWIFSEYRQAIFANIFMSVPPDETDRTVWPTTRYSHWGRS